MRYLKKEGSLYTPAFCAVTGERLPDIDLLISLGAARDGRWDRVRPMTVTVPYSPPMPPLLPPENYDPSDFTPRAHIYDFAVRGFEGKPTLCVVMRSEGELPPASKWEFTEQLRRECYEVCRHYAHNV